MVDVVSFFVLVSQTIFWKQIRNINLKFTDTQILPINLLRWNVKTYKSCFGIYIRYIFCGILSDK